MSLATLVWSRVAAAAACLATTACNIGSCSKYASEYSCSYIENGAEYEVWYWSHVERDDEGDNKMIGRATGVRMCEANARSFAAATGDEFTDRSYICVLMKDGYRIEKHRLIA